ncbi:MULTISPECIES: type II toxin-antitoxin system RelE/ParE family toxin [unclassified Mesorhizobium]|uniref:type II toxin-antitoxin system RelE/ParE family toxin n=1 Tax=unclassified Mesorhizobium TaxID=325217 RepID=UPI000FDBBA2F|nr:MULTISPECIES: type II toxin-antitoxin system RelE/ParE family toxin [unclassified Mesorhizobium]TGQ41981.1 type II toxin-antitoxin system RelE/ParE family toxin [Mesorhizobium sp. M00.F.Ca.ET.216.01.1.1]TIS86638.1 MAG: type II toxin-antitoxin system RelE/ParE family toxin [Mesorhizobium sp.]TJW14820.1 MAG: type II toxin-antitoxin system RelE/ParE family toxin [Mesorhizobium sp.]TJW40826.1 MAG: type II toxin-antitoxin system RelE/ParE family toxin [Mesorhizobium sp.]
MIQRLAVVLSEGALADLESIAAYVLDRSGSEGVANNFIDRIKVRCGSIGNAPRGDRSRDDIVPGLRTVPFEHSAIIAYIVDDDLVRIVNIFYGGRDYETLMRDGGSSEAS